MQHIAVRSLALAVLGALLLLASPSFDGGAARAQTGSIPDVRGSYDVNGVFTYENCVEGIPVTAPIVTTVNVNAQQDASIGGTVFEFHQEGVAYVQFDAILSSTGQFSGTYFWTDPDVDSAYTNKRISGEIRDGNISLELTGTVPLAGEGGECTLTISLSSGNLLLSWTGPDLESGELNPPPRDLVAGTYEGGAPAKTAERSPGTGSFTGVKIYRSNRPNVQPTPANFFAMVPPTQTSIPASAGLGGSYFVVTACYTTGESEPSNEVDATAIPGPALQSITVTPKKLTAFAEGFQPGVTVSVDGVDFASAPKLKKQNTKLLQKGALSDGQTIAQVFAPGRVVRVAFRNADGGRTTVTFPRPTNMGESEAFTFRPAPVERTAFDVRAFLPRR